MPSSLRTFVQRRANDTCEYYQTAQDFYRSAFQPDHIIEEVHSGPTAAHNLCWACFHGNLQKGTNLAGIDPKTAKKAWLYNPRALDMKNRIEFLPYS